MKVEAAFLQVRRLFLDTAPLIYLFERNPTYVSAITAVFRAIDEAGIVTVTSPITLAECLVVPIRLASLPLQQRYMNQLVHGRNTVFARIDELLPDVPLNFVRNTPCGWPMRSRLRPPCR